MAGLFLLKFCGENSPTLQHANNNWQSRDSGILYDLGLWLLHREIYKFYESRQERPSTIDCLLLLDKGEIPEGLDGLPVRTVRVNSMVMKKLSGLQSTESTDTVSLMKVPSTFHNLDDNWQEADCRRWFPSAHRILVLDGIQVVALLNNSFLFSCRYTCWYLYSVEKLDFWVRKTGCGSHKSELLKSGNWHRFP